MSRTAQEAAGGSSQQKDSSQQKQSEAGETQVPPRGTDLRLAAVAACVWVGALTALLVGGWLAALAVVAVVCLLASVLLSVRKRGAAVACLVLAVSFTLSFATATQAAKTFETDPVTFAARAGPTRVGVVAKVVSAPVQSTQSWQRGAVRVNVRTLRAGSEASRVQLWVEIPGEQAAAQPLVPGSIVRLDGTVDAVDWLRAPAAGRMRASSVDVLKQAPRWQRFADTLRNELREVASVAGQDAALITGMSVGDDALLPKETKQAMLTSSMTHLTAVSGTHIAVTVAALAFAFRGRRRAQLFAAGAFLVFILAVVGPTPSVIRACSMSALGLYAALSRRPSQSVALLAAVVVAGILVNPWLAVSVGFALSSIATAAIVLAVGPVRRCLGNARLFGKRHLPRSLASALAVAVVAHFATLPVLPVLNPWLPTWGIVANLAVSPVVAPLTLLGLAACLTCLWWPGLAHVFVWLATPCAAWVRIVAVNVASWPFARMPWPEGGGGVALMLCVACLVAVPTQWAWERRVTQSTQQSTPRCYSGSIEV